MKNYYLYGLVCLLLCLFTTTHATAQKSRTSKAYKKAQKKKKQQERRAKLDQYLGTPNTAQKTRTIDIRRNQSNQRTVDVRRNKRNTPSSAKTNRKAPAPTKKTTKKRGRKDYQQVQLIDNAKVYLGTPYQWGGNGGKGFDCSGLTQTVFKKAGYNLPRTAQEQSRAGRKISLSKVEKGDLVFFGKRNKITHVGIVVSGKREPLRIIHSTSSEGVTITNINQSKYWKKRLKKAIRVIG